MGFWIFLAICSLLIPITMICFGKYFLKHAPKDINNFFGYRTSRSKRSQASWDYAHDLFGRLWVKWGWICGAVTIILLLPGLKMTKEELGWYIILIEVIQMLFLLVPILPVERALKKNFDKDGNSTTRE